MIERTKTWWGLFKLRLKAIKLILFKPKHRWILCYLSDDDFLEYLKGNEHNIKAYFYRMDSYVSVEIMEEIVKNRKKVERPSDRLVNQTFTGRENLN